MPGGLIDRSIGDGLITVRPFGSSDQIALLRGRDSEFYRFLGEGSAEPAPAGCIWLGTTPVGWIDFDDERVWLGENEVNVGYGVFPQHRGNGYATRALRLLCRYLEGQTPPLQPTLLIDPANSPSLAVARRAGFEHTADIEGEMLFRPMALGSGNGGR
ncbi:MAG: GNAT family N-acetyltransferase [Acidimicrobiales bacterium]|nr:GNAT family N-acetyltransferase [Acidimicrobiales bacterium]